MMETNLIVQQAIERLESQKHEKQREIQVIDEQIEIIKVHPEYCITLKDIMEQLKKDPDYLVSGKKSLWTALHYLTKGYGIDFGNNQIKTLFDISQMTEKELNQRRGIGIKMVEQVKDLLREYGLSLKE